MGAADLTACRVVHMEDAQVMRRIRNACRDGFSHATAEIRPGEQALWWNANRDRVQAWLYEAGDGRGFIGFGMLRPLNGDDGPLVTTVAVLPLHRGHGHGKAISRDLVERAGDRPVAGQARLDNPAAVALHDADYWERVEGPDPRLAYFRAIPRAVLAVTA